MIFLYIFGVLLLLVALLLSLKVKITLIYKKDPISSAEVGVVASAGPVKIPLFPKKKKKIRLRKFSHKNYQKLLQKERAAEKQRSKKKKTSAPPKKPKEESSLSFKELFPDDFGEAVEFVADFLKKFGSRIRCDVIRLILLVGTKDAATTAYTTFGITFGVDSLLSLIDKYATLKLKEPENVSVTPDFNSTELSGDVKLSFSIRIGSVIVAAGGVIAAFFRKLIAKNK